MVRGQTAIKGDKLNPPKPKAETCEWCEQTAVGALDVMARVKGKRGARVATGMRVFYCRAHKKTAERFVSEPVR